MDHEKFTEKEALLWIKNELENYSGKYSGLAFDTFSFENYISDEQEAKKALQVYGLEKAKNAISLYSFIVVDFDDFVSFSNALWITILLNKINFLTVKKIADDNENERILKRINFILERRA